MEYISREALDKACEDFCYSKYDKSAFVFMRKLQDIPAADVVPVRHGEWVEIGHETECPFCGEPTGLMTPFCPQCGAKLDRPKR